VLKTPRIENSQSACSLLGFRMFQFILNVAEGVYLCILNKLVFIVTYYRSLHVTMGRPRCSCGLRRWSAAAWSLGSRVWIPLRAWMFIHVTCVCCVCSSHCDEPITHSDESYVIWTHSTAIKKVKLRYEHCYPYGTISLTTIQLGGAKLHYHRPYLCTTFEGNHSFQ
jgi:hypothetical protein